MVAFFIILVSRVKRFMQFIIRAPYSNNLHTRGPPYEPGQNSTLSLIEQTHWNRASSVFKKKRHFHSQPYFFICKMGFTLPTSQSIMEIKWSHSETPSIVRQAQIISLPDGNQNFTHNFMGDLVNTRYTDNYQVSFYIITL